MDPEIRELIRRLLGDLSSADGGFPEATADSIFQSLGAPQVPIQLGIDQGDAANFNEKTRQITFDMDNTFRSLGRAALRAKGEGRNLDTTQAFAESSIPGILTHELFHQATINTEGELAPTDPDVKGLIAFMENRFDNASPEQRRNIFANYYREGNIPLDELGREVDPTRDRLSIIEQAELFASVAQGAFGLARIAKPGVDIKSLLESADERLPGTREAFNFFVRRFPTSN